jgi:hypothetical protein
VSGRAISLALAALLLVGCSHHRREQASAQPRGEKSIFLWRVVRSARARELGLGDLFGERVGDRACTIHGGGPAPGVRFPGRCRVEVQLHGKAGVATFTETWRPVDNGPARKPDELWHAWRVLANRQGRVFFVSSFGAYPPQSWK